MRHIHNSVSTLKEFYHMDLTQLLPLLGGDEKTTALLKAANGDKTSLLKGLAGENANTAKILGLMSALGNDKRQKKGAVGISAVADFANNDIVGALFKLLKECTFFGKGIEFSTSPRSARNDIKRRSAK